MNFKNKTFFTLCLLQATALMQGAAAADNGTKQAVNEQWQEKRRAEHTVAMIQTLATRELRIGNIPRDGDPISLAPEVAREAFTTITNGLTERKGLYPEVTAHLILTINDLKNTQQQLVKTKDVVIKLMVERNLIQRQNTLLKYTLATMLIIWAKLCYSYSCNNMDLPA